MKVDILGAWGGYPAQGGATAGYLITTDKGQVLVDCGSGVMSKLSLKTKIEHLDSVVLSHLHYDHTADIKILQYAAVGALRNEKMAEKLQIHAPMEPKKYWDELQSEVSEFMPVTADSIIYSAGMKIEFQPVSHTIPCYAIKFTYNGNVFVYSADTSYDERLIEFAADADLFICEATICPGSTHTVGTGHMDASEAGLIANKANVQQLVLTHLPHDGNFEVMKEQAERTFKKPVITALDNNEFYLE